MLSGTFPKYHIIFVHLRLTLIPNENIIPVAITRTQTHIRSHSFTFSNICKVLAGIRMSYIYSNIYLICINSNNTYNSTWPRQLFVSKWKVVLNAIFLYFSSPFEGMRNFAMSEHPQSNICYMQFGWWLALVAALQFSLCMCPFCAQSSPSSSMWQRKIRKYWTKVYKMLLPSVLFFSTTPQSVIINAFSNLYNYFNSSKERKKH